MHPQDRLFCEIAVQLQLLTRQQATSCMQAQEREAVGQSVATVAMALGFMDQAAVDAVLHQQQRVLERRREAREASRVQREVESRAAAGIGLGDAASMPTDRPPAPRGAGASGAAPRREAFESVPAAAALSAEAGPRYSGTFGEARHSSSSPRNSGFSEARNSLAPGDARASGAPRDGWGSGAPDARGSEAPGDGWGSGAPDARGSGAPGEMRSGGAHGSGAARDARNPPPGEARKGAGGARAGVFDEAEQLAHDTHDLRDTLDERPPLRRNLLRHQDDELDGRQTVPLDRTAAAPASSKPPARASSSLPPSAADGAVAQSARGTLLESSGMEQQRRELAEPQRHATGRPIPSVRDWRNPSRPPPAAEGFEIEMPLRSHHSLSPKALSSRPPAQERRSSRPPLTIAAPPLDAPKHVDRALELCAQHGASDYHLHSGALPRLRIDGTLHSLRADQAASEQAVERVLAEVLCDEDRMQLTLDGELRIIHVAESGIRARLSAFVSEQGSHVQLHPLPMDVPSAEQLGLASALNIVREKPWGLAICTGPAGSGITTTLWALAHALASERARYSVSLESPLELNVRCGVGLFEQREVGRHIESYAAGIAWALAEGADIIVVSDLLAPGAFEASLHAARARCLVVAGMRAGSSFAALRRLLSEAQGDAELLRRSLADGLRLLTHQRLLPRRGASGGSVAAIELVLGGGRLMQHLRRAEMLQLAAAFEVSHDPELFTLRDALNDLVRGSVISTDSMRSALGVDRACLEG